MHFGGSYMSTTLLKSTSQLQPITLLDGVKSYCIREHILRELKNCLVKWGRITAFAALFISHVRVVI